MGESITQLEGDWDLLPANKELGVFGIGKKRIAVVGRAPIGSGPEVCVVGTAVHSVVGFAAGDGRFANERLRLGVSPEEDVR